MGIGATIGAMSGGVGEMLGSLWSAKQSRDAQRRSWKYQQIAMQNKFQWAADDLQKAGLNRVLAMGPGAAGAQSGPGMNPVGNPAAGLGATARAVMKFADEKKIQKNAVEQSYHEAYKSQAIGADYDESVRERRERIRMLRTQRLGQQIQNAIAGEGLASAKAAGELYRDHPWLRKAKEIMGVVPGSPVRGTVHMQR